MNEEKYLEMDFRDDVFPFKVSRRDFVKTFGAGIFIFFAVGESLVCARQTGRRGYPSDLNAYLRINEDGRVSCLTGKIEMGQGIFTSLAQELADELDVSIDSVDMVMGDTDLCPWDMGTFGSLTTRNFAPHLRRAAATARAVLLELASEQLQIPIENLSIKEGVIFDKIQKEKRITFAELSKGKVITKKLDEKISPKKPSQFNVIGKPFSRRDSIEKVTGKAEFAGDIFLPDMLYAKILRPPAHGAKLKAVDTSAAEKIIGIKIVKDGDLVAVLHKYPDVAEQALSKINAEFDIPEAKVDDNSIFEHLLKVAGDGEVISNEGDVKKGEEQSTTTIESTYLNSYVAHATIEPHTAVAKIKGDKLTTWVSTQAPFRIQSQIAEALNMDAENVRVITPFVGGGFGGKTPGQQAIEAARLAKLTGKPVQVAWTRDEEFFNDTFRPAAVVKIKSGLSDSGKPTLWNYHVYFAGQRGSQHFYKIPHHQTVSYGSSWRGTPGSHPFSTGAWRAPANNTNTYARESQIDIMAEKAGQDALDFRLKHLNEEKMSKALKAAADKFGWTPVKAPSGRGFGIACGTDVDTFVAVIAEVNVNQANGHVQVKRVVAAQEMGQIVNPQGAKLQMEGCVAMGLGYALMEEIHFKGGEIFDTNFDTYEIPRFSWMPKIETVLVDSDDLAPHGGGEPVIICMGGAIANAVYDTIGVRLYQLPMTPERILEALNKG